MGLFWQLEKVSDTQLVNGLERLIGSGRRALAELIAHLSEVEERRLHLDAGHPSMFAYCTSKLGLSEDEAYRRIAVARLARRVPAVFELLASGELSLSVAALLKPYRDAANLDRLVQALRGKSMNAARELLVKHFPEPDAPSSIRKLPAQGKMPSAQVPLPAAPTNAQENPSSIAQTAARPPARPVEPLSEARYRVQFTADPALKEKLELARDLLRHAIPSGDLALLLGRALDLLIAEHMKRRFGARCNKARANQPLATPDSSHSPTVSRAIRRSVLERDGLRCTWHGDGGQRCSARAWLERDHIQPRARGGCSTHENVRHLCRAHNQRAAELAYGRDHIEHAKTMRKNALQGANCPRNQAPPPPEPSAKVALGPDLQNASPHGASGPRPARANPPHAQASGPSRQRSHMSHRPD